MILPVVGVEACHRHADNCTPKRGQVFVGKKVKVDSIRLVEFVLVVETMGFGYKVECLEKALVSD